MNKQLFEEYDRVYKKNILTWFIYRHMLKLFEEYNKAYQFYIIGLWTDMNYKLFDEYDRVCKQALLSLREYYKQMSVDCF